MLCVSVHYASCFRVVLLFAVSFHCYLIQSGSNYCYQCGEANIYESFVQSYSSCCLQRYQRYCESVLRQQFRFLAWTDVQCVCSSCDSVVCPLHWLSEILYPGWQPLGLHLHCVRGLVRRVNFIYNILLSPPCVVQVQCPTLFPTWLQAAEV